MYTFFECELKRSIQEKKIRLFNNFWYRLSLKKMLRSADVTLYTLSIYPSEQNQLIQPFSRHGLYLIWICVVLKTYNSFQENLIEISVKIQFSIKESVCLKISQKWHYVKVYGICTQCTLYSSTILILLLFLSARFSYEGMYYCCIRHAYSTGITKKSS